MIKIVAFDLDGVLLDDSFHDEALKHALRDFGYTDIFDEHVAPLRGLPTRVKMEMLVEQEVIDEKEMHFIARRKQIYTEEYIESIQPCVPLQMLFRNLVEQAIPVAVVSNAREVSTVKILTKLGLLSYVANVVTTDMLPDLKPKPDPSMYTWLSERWQVDPKEILVVEDSERGVQAAIAAGCPFIRVSDSTVLRNDLLLVQEVIDEYNQRVALVIATYNGGSFLRRAVESLCTSDAGVPVDLYIVDNGSTPENKKLAKELVLYHGPHGSVIHNDAGGFDTTAYRRAFETLPMHPYYMFCQDDVEFHDGWATELLSHMSEYVDEDDQGIQVVALSTFGALYDSQEQLDYTKSIVDIGVLLDVPSIFGPIFMATWDAMESARMHPSWNMLVENKLQQQAWERGWGQLFGYLGIGVDALLPGRAALMPGNHSEIPIQHGMANWTLGHDRGRDS